MLQELFTGRKQIGPSSSTKKLLDININFDGKYPEITYTYFDKENRTEIVETYITHSLSMTQDFDNSYEFHTLEGRSVFFNKTIELRDMSLINRRINKL